MSAAPALFSSPAPAPQRLAKELWISFASLLRSHVAMHAMARPEARLRMISDKKDTGLLEVLGIRGKLTVLQPNASGTVAIEFRPESADLDDEYSAFFFSEDGSLHFVSMNDAMDMEAAVEYLVAKVHV